MIAIVTGASEGLGKALAFELAGRGINLVLVALPASGLQQLARFIRLNFNVRVIYVEGDLTNSTTCTSLFEMLEQQGVKADMLINNAGLGNWSRFEEKDVQFYKKQIDLNITSTVLLSRLFIGQAVAGRTIYLMNVGSLNSYFVVPRKQVYGACKSFVSHFTRCLQLEQADKNVRISLLSPGATNTKPELLVINHRLKGISAQSVLEPEVVAKAAVDGLLKGKKEIVPGAVNRGLLVLNRMLPNFIKEIIVRKQLRLQTGA